MAKAKDIQVGQWVNYKLSSHALKAGEIRKAKVTRANVDGTLNLIVELQDGDFSDTGRVLSEIKDSRGRVVAKELHSKIIDNYLFVNFVANGDNEDNWK